MKRTLCILLVLLLALPLSACGFFGESQVDYTTKNAAVFSSDGLFIEIIAERGKKFNDAFDKIIEEFEEIDRQINVHRTGYSDVLTINQAQKGQQVEIGKHTYALITLAKQLYESTGKTLNIAAYPLSYLWAVDAISLSDFRAQKNTADWTIPPSFTGSQILRTLPEPSYQATQLIKEYADLDKLSVSSQDNRFFAVKTEDNLMIELGALAKGYAADLAAEILRSSGIKSAQIDLSGNIKFVGKYHLTQSWTTGIAIPKIGNYELFAAVKTGADQSVVTSGDYERFRMFTKGSDIDDKLYVSHIINTGTGLPYNISYDGMQYNMIEDRVVSASVFNENSALSDGLTTAACVLGLEKAARLLVDAGVNAILITAQDDYVLIGDIEFVMPNLYDGFKSFNKIELADLLA